MEKSQGVGNIYRASEIDTGCYFGVNEKLLTQHISGLVTKYKLLYVINRSRAGARAAWTTRARARG